MQNGIGWETSVMINEAVNKIHTIIYGVREFKFTNKRVSIFHDPGIPKRL